MKKKFNSRIKLFIYDAVVLLLVHFVLMFLYKGGAKISFTENVLHYILSFACIAFIRLAFEVYKQIWRYSSIQSYLRIILSDIFAFLLWFAIERLSPMPTISFARLLAIWSINLLVCMTMRMVYRYVYQRGNDHSPLSSLLSFLVLILGGERIDTAEAPGVAKIHIAIVGAGKVGVSLAEDLLDNPSSIYYPACFIDSNIGKAGRTIRDIPIIYEGEDTFAFLEKYGVKEIVFAIPTTDEKERRRLFEYYAQTGCKLKVYDFPIIETANAKRHLREFDIEDLLFRKPILIRNEKTDAYYENKIVLVTGGGGSIGGELCRQIAKKSPKKLIILDICENGAYDIEQDLKRKYRDSINVQVEIASITNKAALERVFASEKPEIVINAAAHKHVPLMEHNCVEAVENNIFGCVNLIELCEKYGTERFMMVSTDKAVNPTNVMGATKRFCEMLVLSASKYGKVKYSATRFGNVLGSAGSVIPLFKKQIAEGGPITVTDKRIIRYFMTIPEASSLVLESGAMANNGELFVLDMGQPIKILELAESMIRLSGSIGIEIIETGLRPGEKLYEELLVNTEELDKTDNDLIFIEREEAPDRLLMDERLSLLISACSEGDNDKVRKVLKKVVPTYKDPEVVNAEAEKSKEYEAAQSNAGC